MLLINLVDNLIFHCFGIICHDVLSADIGFGVTPSVHSVILYPSPSLPFSILLSLTISLLHYLPCQLDSSYFNYSALFLSQSPNSVLSLSSISLHILPINHSLSLCRFILSFLSFLALIFTASTRFFI